MKTKYRIRKILSNFYDGKPEYKYVIEKKFLLWWITPKLEYPLMPFTDFCELEHAEKALDMYFKYKDKCSEVVKEIKI